MSRADNGDFDLMFTVSIAEIARRIGQATSDGVDLTLPVPLWGDLTLKGTVALTELRGTSTDTIVGTVSTAGTTLTWPELSFAGVVVVEAGTRDLTVTVSLDATPKAQGVTLSVDFASDAARVTLSTGSLELIPGVKAWLAFVELIRGRAAMEAERTRLKTQVETALSSGVNTVVPDSVTVGHLPSPPIHAVTLSVRQTELRALLTVGGPTGSSAAITRSILAAGDVAGVVVDNHCLLRDVLRPALTAALGLSTDGFDASDHPCWWFGTTPMPANATVGGVLPNITSVRGWTDQLGALHVTIPFSGRLPGDAGSWSGSVDVGFSVALTPVTASGPGATPHQLMSVALSTCAVDLDVSLEWWVYLVGVLVGGSLVALATTLVDAFAGSVASSTIEGAIRNAIGPAATLSVPVPALPENVLSLKVTSLRTMQPDAEWHLYSLKGTVPPYYLPGHPANDVIATVG